MNSLGRHFLLLPDPLLSIQEISGAVLLYFDGPFISVLPPVVVTPESFSLFDLACSRGPAWAEDLALLIGALQITNQLARETKFLLDRTAPDLFKSAYIALPANFDAYERVTSWVTAAGYSYEDLESVIDPTMARAELARHIFLEKYLECDRDLEKLYRYSAEIFSSPDLSDFIVASYLLRLQAFVTVPEDQLILLTNQRIAPLLERIRHSNQEESGSERPNSVSNSPEPMIAADVVAWEFFRVLVSRAIDPLDEKRLQLVVRSRNSQKDEIDRLKYKCRELATDLLNAKSIVGLEDKAAGIIDSKLRKEMKLIFELDEKAWRGFLNSISEDKVIWGSLASMLGGVSLSGPIFTTAGLVGLLSTIGAAAVKARNSREAQLAASDLSLLHTLKRNL